MCQVQVQNGFALIAVRFALCAFCKIKIHDRILNRRPAFRCPTYYYLLLTYYYLLFTIYFLLITYLFYQKLPTATVNRSLSTSHFQLLTFNFSLSTSHFQLLTYYFPLITKPSKTSLETSNMKQQKQQKPKNYPL